MAGYGYEVDFLPVGNGDKSGDAIVLRYGEPGSYKVMVVDGHRWLAMLESGEVKTLTEIAKREGVDNSYVSRMVNLTTLAPDIVAAILDDTLPDTITLLELAADPPVLWGGADVRVNCSTHLTCPAPE